MVLQHSSVGNPYVGIKQNTCYGMPMQRFPLAIWQLDMHDCCIRVSALLECFEWT